MQLMHLNHPQATPCPLVHGKKCPPWNHHQRGLRRMEVLVLHFKSMKVVLILPVREHVSIVVGHTVNQRVIPTWINNKYEARFGCCGREEGQVTSLAWSQALKFVRPKGRLIYFNGYMNSRSGPPEKKKKVACSQLNLVRGPPERVIGLNRVSLHKAEQQKPRLRGETAAGKIEHHCLFQKRCKEASKVPERSSIRHLPNSAESPAMTM